MISDDHQLVIDQLQGVIDETQHTLERFESSGMDEQMRADYDTLLAILDDAVTQQREYTLAMLGG
ncbi:hypothetical protein [Halomonas daqiaonensis]|uniref:Uncharacterized protein n=1 Tax=Halomonas daqiaonensis TaxID=650850 RepID=A0A1H7SM25_9GAMM|nr:hypothetical protein [Halomonas daqiaonensis]SEL73672.1 hypothetical protein SAMN04488129_11517 [Halomonas daqiaonensis]